MVWSNRSFRKLFFANGISNFGDWFDFIAMTILFGFQWRVDPMTLALLPLVYAGPGMLFGQVAGMLADRLNQQHLLIITDLFRAGCTLLILMAPGYEWALLLLLLRSIADTVSSPAQQTLLRHIVDPRHLLQATTMNGTVQQAAKIIGPLLGASFIAFFSVQVCLWLNSISFLLSAVLLCTLPKRIGSHTEQQSSTKSLMMEWRQGWQWLTESRIILVSLLYSLLAGFAIQCIDVQFVTLFREVAPTRPELTGWVISALGIGSLSILLLLNRMGSIPSYGIIFGGGISLLAILFIWLGTLTQLQSAVTIIWTLLAALIGGFGNGLLFAGLQYLIQAKTPVHLIGRITGIMDSLRSFIFLISPILGGLIVERIGVTHTFGIIGSFLLILGLVGFIMRHAFWREKENLPHSL